ncbi:MAG: precorrin-6A reductase [Lachnospiraceae bacterium]|nr:precorrin-6A reductase [Lachnospiraceae bacterium]
MKRVLIYAGTTEGRLLSRKLAENEIPSEVRVATEYGREVMHGEKESQWILVRQGRLATKEMSELLDEGDYLAVVDATHPYATEVTKNIKESMEGKAIPYFRLARNLEEASQLTKQCQYYNTAQECAEKLAENYARNSGENSAENIPQGNIFLTTGSKELESFCADENLRKRLVVRVLPGRESMELCWKAGLEGKQIIAMQGPFTKEMNLATIRQYGITALVTKESGKIGGTDEKLEAAKEAGIACHVIRKPACEDAEAMSFEEVLAEILRLTGKETCKTGAEAKQGANAAFGAEAKIAGDASNSSSLAALDIVLAGIGMGAETERTMALEKRLQETDYLFGAKRMIAGIAVKKGSFPYYLEKDIVPCLEQLQREERGNICVTILFSGDTGFYSGAEKLVNGLRRLPNVNISIFPGISTISALGAKFGVSWGDAMIMSTHGTAKERWKVELLFGMRHGRKIFFLTSGAEDVREIGRIMKAQGFADCYRIKLGYQLSYPEEELFELTAGDAQEITQPGLYAGFLLPADRGTLPEGIASDGIALHGSAPGSNMSGNTEPAGNASCSNMPCAITHGWPDEVFLRDRVPMTKEEVREISICKLRLTETATFWDVGSGTGSIAMEVAALSPGIRVYAIERKPEAVELIQRNKEKFGAENVAVIEAEAPDGLEGLPAPTHVFLGGSGGKMKAILDMIMQKNPAARVVMNAISLESMAQMQTLLAEYPVTDLEITTVNVSKAKQVGDYHLMQAGNPVTIFSFTLRGEK